MKSDWIKIRFSSPPGQTDMHRKILLFLASESESASNPAGSLCDAQGNQPEIQVVVPAHTLLLTEVTLPPLSAYRLQQALPYALEDQVLDELDLLHFAPAAAKQPEGKIAVAIMKKARLEEWLAFLQDRGLQPDQLIPAVFILPYQEKHWQVLIEGKMATVRTGLFAGFSTELENLETLLSLKVQEAGQAPEKLVLYQEPGPLFSFSALSLPLERKTLTLPQKQALAEESLRELPSINLLQGTYASKRKRRIPENNKKAWRLAAYACLLWLGLLLCSSFGSLLLLSYEHYRLQSSIEKIYQAHFPMATTLIDPQGRLEAQLKKALAQSEKNLLFQGLGYLAKTASPVRLQSFHFQNKQLHLEVLAPSFASLDDYILSLKAQGAEIRQQNAALTGTQVKALLLMEGDAT